jgi:starch synthase
VQVSKRRDPVKPVGRYGPGSGAGNAAARGAATFGRNGALPGGEIKSIVAAPTASIVKFEGPGYTVILPTQDIIALTPPRTVAPTSKPPLPPSEEDFVSRPPASIPKPDTYDNAELAEKKRAQADIGGVSNPIPPTPPPAPEVEEATWDFKQYIGFDDPAEMKAGAGADADADAAGSFENYKNDDPGPLAGENVMNVIVVAAECSPWCKTGKNNTVCGFF